MNFIRFEMIIFGQNVVMCSQSVEHSNRMRNLKFQLKHLQHFGANVVVSISFFEKKTNEVINR